MPLRAILSLASRSCLNLNWRFSSCFSIRSMHSSRQTWFAWKQRIISWTLLLVASLCTHILSLAPHLSKQIMRLNRPPLLFPTWRLWWLRCACRLRCNWKGDGLLSMINMPLATHIMHASKSIILMLTFLFVLISSIVLVAVFFCIWKFWKRKIKSLWFLIISIEIIQKKNSLENSQ